MPGEALICFAFLGCGLVQMWHTEDTNNAGALSACSKHRKYHPGTPFPFLSPFLFPSFQSHVRHKTPGKSITVCCLGSEGTTEQGVLWRGPGGTEHSALPLQDEFWHPRRRRRPRERGLIVRVYAQPCWLFSLVIALCVHFFAVRHSVLQKLLK